MLAENRVMRLICPETRAPLLDADAALVSRLNARIDAGELKNRVGATVGDHMTAALVRDDQQYAYAVVDGIAKMLIDEAIPLAQLSE